MAFGYRYRLERQENGWWLVRFPGIPEALTEGETREEARANALDCVLAALEGYMKAGKPLPRKGAGHSGPDRAALPSLVTAKLAAYETMRGLGWTKAKLAKQLGMPENSVRRLLDLRHSSHKASCHGQSQAAASGGRKPLDSSARLGVLPSTRLCRPLLRRQTGRHQK